MKYKLVFHRDGDDFSIGFDSEIIFDIYRSRCDPRFGGVYNDWWTNGFWNNMDYVVGKTEYMAMREDYFSHREEYIAEANKLLIKEML